MPRIFSSLIPTRTSASSSPSAESTGMTSQERGFLQKLVKRKPATRSFGHRVEGAVHKAAKVIGRQVRSPAPHSFAALERDYTAWSALSPKLPFDEREAGRLRQMASSYIARASASGCPGVLGKAKIHQASCYVLALDKAFLAHRRVRQALIDAQYPERFAAGHAQRDAGREGHAQALRRMRQEFDRTDGRADVAGWNPVVEGADGAAVYRFHPAPSRTAVGRTGWGPANAVLASALNDRLKLHLRVDFGFPEATVAALDGSTGVLVDGDALLLEGGTGADMVDGTALRQAVLAQWLIGKPRARWGEMRYDTQGLLRLAQPAMDVLSPRNIAQEALRGVSPLFTHPVRTDETMAELHCPIDRGLADRVLRLDLGRLAKDLIIDRERIDIAVALRGNAKARSPRHFTALREDAIGRLLEPLRALQVALKAGRDLPLAMVLADAAEELLHSPYA